MDMILDVAGAAAGRVASVAAKELLKGKHVCIVNAEKAVISGDPSYTISTTKEKIKRGDPIHGPFYPKSPDRMLKRMVRGMMPYKKPMGRKAFKSLRVYVAVPEICEGEKITFQPCKGKSVTLEELSRRAR